MSNNNKDEIAILQRDLSVYHTILRNAFNCCSIALALLGVSRYYRNKKRPSINRIFLIFSCIFLLCSNYFVYLSQHVNVNKHSLFEYHLYTGKFFHCVITGLLIFELWLLYNSF